MSKDRKQLITLILLIAFGLGYSYYTYLFVPEWAGVKQLNLKLENRQKRFEQLSYYKNNPTLLQAESKNYEAQASELQAQLPNSLDKANLIFNLYSLSKENQLQPQSLSFEQIQKKGTYQTMAINLTCTGKVGNILSFVNKLQTGTGSNHKLTIQSFNLVNNQGTMRADIKLIAYATNYDINKQNNQKPGFMNSPIGIDSTVNMFQ